MLVILEGNISAGKSTLAQELGTQLGCKVFLEPTQTNPWLAKFYEDPAKYALKMQLWLLRQRYYTYIAALKMMLDSNMGVILDRSVFSDKVFADKCHEDGLISHEGYAYYLALRSRMLAALPLPHVTVYLDVDPKECHRRILHERCRECESGIPLDYLAGLHSWYGQFLRDMAETGCAVVTHDWNAFGAASDVAAAIRSAVSPLATSLLTTMTITGDSVDQDSVRTFVHADARVKDAMVLPYVVDGVDDADELPPPIDFDLEAKLTAARTVADPASITDTETTTLAFEVAFSESDDGASSSEAATDAAAATTEGTAAVSRQLEFASAVVV